MDLDSKCPVSAEGNTLPSASDEHADPSPPQRTPLARRALTAFLTTTLTWVLSPAALNRLPIQTGPGACLVALGAQILLAGTCMLACYRCVRGRESMTLGEVAFLGPHLMGPWVLWGLGRL